MMNEQQIEEAGERTINMKYEIKLHTDDGLVTLQDDTEIDNETETCKRCWR